MARDYQTKSNVGGVVDSITATRLGGGEFNSIANELENAVTSSDQTLAPADGTGEVSNQLSMALAIYGAGGAQYCVDSGAVNAYVLNPVSPKDSIPTYFDGMTLSFEPGTDNTTASTVNYASIGIKSITLQNGNALTGGELSGTCMIKYNLTDDRFELMWATDGILAIPDYFEIDSSQSDQGATSTNSETLTIYDVASLVGTSKYATIHLRHNPKSGNQTYYYFDTSLDLSSYPYLTFQFDQGAMIGRVTGDEIFTVYSARNFIFTEHQSIVTANAIIDFAIDAPIYGSVDVFPWISSSYSNVRRPDGLWIDVSSSTTMGLQEAIDFSCGDGTSGSADYTLNVFGREESSGGAEVFNCTTPLVFPAMQGKKIEMPGITINFTSAIGSSSAVVIDSCMMVDINMPGTQIVSAGTGPVLEFVTTNPVPLDAVRSIIDSNFHICTIVTSVATSTAANALVKFSPGAYGIICSTFTFEEINGLSLSTNSVGVLVADPSGGGFSNNKFKCMHIHGVGAVGLHIGTSTSIAGSARGNIWEMSCIGESESASRAIDTFGTNDIFIFNTPGSTFDYAIRLESSAANNLFIASDITGAVAVMDNNATDITSNLLINSNSIAPVSITVGSSPFVYQNKMLQDMVVVISGGTVTDVSISHDNSTYYSTGVTEGTIILPRGFYVQVTYSSAPTILYYLH